MRGLAWSASTLAVVAGVCVAGPSFAQQPYPPVQPPAAPYPAQPAPQPYVPPPQYAPAPPQGYPPQQPAPPAPQPYTPAPQPYPPAPQPYPPAPQPYPPAPQPYAPPYGQPAPYPPYPAQPPPTAQPPQPYGQPAYPPPPAYGQPQYPPQQQPPAPYQPFPQQPTTSKYRGAGEMVFLYGIGLSYGVGTGIWLDLLAHEGDPGIAFIAPLAFGAAIPVATYFLDNYSEFHRGVPASISTGLTLGALEGIAIAGTQWHFAGDGGPNAWSPSTDATVAWLLSTGGGVGGYLFGEWLRPDPRSLAFIASGGGWGAIAGSLLGAGVVSGDWKDGASVAGLVGYNLGILATGALSAVYVPSWKTQKYMWAGFVGGSVAASLVYVFYLFSDANPRHGLIANSLGGLAGVGVAGVLAANMKDDGPTQNAVKSGLWTPPFQLAIAPVTSPYVTAPTGAAITAFGKF
jgi:hypothetical protein